MALETFTTSDIAAVGWAFAVLALFFATPGYFLGWCFDAFGFRKHGLWLRAGISIPLSIAFSPVLTYLLTRAGSPHLALAVHVGFAIGCGILLAGGFRKEPRPKLTRPVWIFAFAGLAWVAIGTLTMIDLQIHDRLYVPVMSYDYNTRTALVAEISRTGVPPHNPFFYPGHYVPLRYHYFLYLICSMVPGLNWPAFTARHALIAGGLWVGVGLIALMPVAMRFFHPDGKIGLGRRSVLALALLGVTGLDILPHLFMFICTRIVLPDLEWWNTTVMAWDHAVLWVPHHVEAMIACLAGFFLVWDTERLDAYSPRWIAAAAGAGLAFASGVGLSIYVTAIFALFLMVWVAASLRSRRYRDAVVAVAAGAFTVAFALPYLISTTSSTSRTNAFLFTVRPFSIADAILNASGFTQRWQHLVSNTLLLPLNYFLELGVFFTAGVLWLRHARASGWTRYRVALVILLGCSLIPCTVVGTQESNDFQWRGVLPAQFVLLLCACDVIGGKQWAGVRPDLKQLMTLMIIAGATGSAYEIFLARFHPVLGDAGLVRQQIWMAKDNKLGRRTYEARQAYDWVRAATTPAAIVQSNPENWWDLYHGLYSDRQSAAFNYNCVSGFGGDVKDCAPIKRDLATLFEPAAPVSSAHVASVCRDWNLTALIFKDTDPVWADRGSWIWTEKPSFANDYVRVFACPGAALNAQPAPKRGD